MHILGNRTSLDKYVLNGILKHKILGRYELVRLRGTQTAQTALALWPKMAKMAIYGHLAIGPWATKSGKWGIPEKSYKNVAQQW